MLGADLGEVRGGGLGDAGADAVAALGIGAAAGAWGKTGRL